MGAGVGRSFKAADMVGKYRLGGVESMVLSLHAKPPENRCIRDLLVGGEQKCYAQAILAL